MQNISLQASEVKKVFHKRIIFSGIKFSLQEGNSLAIIGRNGSGKSTLVKIIAGILSATSGETSIIVDRNSIPQADIFRHIGFVAPYLQMYEEFSAFENLQIFRKVRGIDISDDHVNTLLKKISLEHRKNDLVRTYSSGMKQRLKFAFALLHSPPVLILDEPSSNLDAEGISSVFEIVEEQKTHGIVVIATNDEEEAGWCSQCIDLNEGSLLIKASG